MKRIVVFCIVSFALAATCAFAQPNTPFILIDQADTLRPPATVAVNSDTIAVFYVGGPDVLRAMYSLQNADFASPPEVLRSDAVWRQEIVDVSIRNYNDWAIAIRMAHDLEIRVNCLFQSENGLFDYYVTSSFYAQDPYDWFATWFLEINVGQWYGAGWFIGYIKEGQSPPPLSEYHRGGAIAPVFESGLDSNYTVMCIEGEQFSFLCNHGPFNLHSISISPERQISLYNANGSWTDSSAIIINQVMIDPYY